MMRGVRSAVLLVLLAGCGSAGDGTGMAASVAVADSIDAIDPSLLAALPEGSTLEELEAGRTGFVVCTVCHGLNGEGTQLGPSLRDTAWIHIPADIDSIARIIRTGVESPEEFPMPMPVMGAGDFDESELRAVASYVYALSRKPL